LPKYELNLQDYLRIIRKRKLIITVCFLVGIYLGHKRASQQIPYYEAKAVLKIEQGRTVAGLLTEWITYSPGDIMISEAKFITGFPVMQKVALRLGLIKEDTPLSEAQQIASELAGSITVKPVEQTNLMEIIVTNQDPKKAMELANTVAEVYIEENLLEKKKQAKIARQFIEEQLASVEKRLRENEESLSKFEKEKLAMKSTKELTPAIENIQNKLEDLEFELAGLLKKYTEKHPRVIQLKSQIEELESRLKRQIETSSKTAEVSDFSERQLEYARLERELEVNKKLYMMFREKLEEARISEAQKTSDVSLVEPAVLPDSPLGTPEKTTTILGGLFGLVLGLGLAFLRESLDTSLGTIEDVESLVNLPVIGVIPVARRNIIKSENYLKRFLDNLFPRPHTKEDEYYLRLIVHYEPKAPISEAYRAIITNIKFSQNQKVILFTSAGPREGKTTVLVNVGLAIAQTGLRTLLVSSDLRRPTIEQSFGLSRQPGLVELVNKSATLPQAIRNISDIMLGGMKLEKIIGSPGLENISILPAGRIPINPVIIFESPVMQEIMQELRAKFDTILFDSPPVLPVADALLLVPKMDAVILVYEAGRTARAALMRAKTQLETAGAKILGIVLNYIQAQAEISVGYPYYYKYKYYSPEKIRR